MKYEQSERNPKHLRKWELRTSGIKRSMNNLKELLDVQQTCALDPLQINDI
jgi:hypothetical protein